MRVWLKRKGNVFEVYQLAKNIKLVGKLEERIALSYQHQKDSCTIEQNNIVEQILCKIDIKD